MKKSNLICYHVIRGSVSMGEMVTVHIRITENVADLSIKVIPRGQKRDHVIGKLLYDVAD